LVQGVGELPDGGGAQRAEVDHGRRSGHQAYEAGRGDAAGGQSLAQAAGDGGGVVGHAGSVTKGRPVAVVVTGRPFFVFAR
jgi:hypothetical protein